MRARPKVDRNVGRFQNLVALVGTVNRCMCGKQGFLAKVSVSSEPLLRKRRYKATWQHPEKNDPDVAEICGYVWP